MIEVAPSTGFMLYLAITLSTLLLIWVSYHFKARKRVVITPEALLLVCEYCQCAYVDDRTKAVTQCPQCNSFNKNNRYQCKK